MPPPFTVFTFAALLFLAAADEGIQAPALLTGGYATPADEWSVEPGTFTTDTTAPFVFNSFIKTCTPGSKLVFQFSGTEYAIYGGAGEDPSAAFPTGVTVTEVDPPTTTAASPTTSSDSASSTLGPPIPANGYSEGGLDPSVVHNVSLTFNIALGTCVSIAGLFLTSSALPALVQLPASQHVTITPLTPLASSPPPSLAPSLSLPPSLSSSSSSSTSTSSSSSSSSSPSPSPAPSPSPTPTPSLSLSPSQSPSPLPHAKATAAAIGGAVGGIALVCIVCGLLHYLLCRRRRSRLVPYAELGSPPRLSSVPPSTADLEGSADRGAGSGSPPQTRQRKHVILQLFGASDGTAGEKHTPRANGPPAAREAEVAVSEAQAAASPASAAATDGSVERIVGNRIDQLQLQVAALSQRVQAVDSAPPPAYHGD